MTANMTEPQIKAALEAGIISDAQAKAMRAVLTPSPPYEIATIGHEDDMRFLRSFSDVFIAIGLGLLILAIFGFIGFSGSGTAYLGGAVLMWVSAEFFGRRLRAHLPTLILALAFLFFTQKGFAIILDKSAILAAVITLGAMSLFYWRIRLPFCIALIAASALFLLFTFLNQFVPNLTKVYLGIILGLSGIAIFFCALAYDVNDQHRTTRFADNAFWLHFLAAPLIIHGLAIMRTSFLTHDFFTFFKFLNLNTKDALIVLAIFTILIIIGLAINRRALIVSSLGYAGLAFASIFIDAGTSVAEGLLWTLLALGGIIVFLGVGWHNARNLIIEFLPKWRVFPPPYDPNFKS